MLRMALAWYERTLAFRPTLPNASFNVVAASLELGRVDRAREVRARFDSLRPGHLVGAALDWMIGWSVPEYQLVDSAIQRLTSIGGRGQPSQMLAVLAESERGAAKGERIPEYLRALSWTTVYEAVVQSRPAEAMARMESALARFPISKLDPVDRPYAELAQFYARANRPARAREPLAEYYREVPRQLHLAAKADLGLAAAFATLAEGRARQAITEFQAADVGQCQVCPLPGLARAWQAAGNDDSVVAVLERYLALPDDDRSQVDPLERAGALTRLAEIYELRGDTARAISKNAEFLALWKDADPAFHPVLERIREKQRRLTAER